MVTVLRVLARMSKWRKQVIKSDKFYHFTMGRGCNLSSSYCATLERERERERGREREGGREGERERERESDENYGMGRGRDVIPNFLAWKRLLRRLEFQQRLEQDKSDGSGVASNKSLNFAGF